MLTTPLNTTKRHATLHSVDQMAVNSHATILYLVELQGLGAESGVLRRLTELGFLPGETVTVLRACWGTR